MKKRFLLLSIVLVSFTAFSFAADAPAISKNIISQFHKQFSNARDIQWENRADFVKARFTLDDNIVLYAYYNKSGDLLALTRFISPRQLPLELLTSLKKNHTGYWISDLFEIRTDAGTAYYATLENADQVTVLKSDGVSGWTVYQREKKTYGE